MLHKLPNDIRELGRTPAFRGLSNRELEALQRFGTVVVRGPGELVVRSCQSASQLVVIIAGEVAATTDDGQRRTLRDGAGFGSFPPWDDFDPERVETITKVTLFVVGRREFATIRNLYPGIADCLTTALLTSPGSVAEPVRRDDERWVGSAHGARRLVPDSR
jgi:signal-transduction protein with cAMP-binding, CBS, and nucleotidyltransferase domain